MDAKELEQKLKERCPLLRWRIEEFSEIGNGGPHIGASVWVNQQLLHCGTEMDREVLASMSPDWSIDYIIDRVRHAVAESIINWRPGDTEEQSKKGSA